MAVRGWGGSVALAVGVAAGSAAAQLGLGYGLGVLVWTSATDTTGVSAWLASLAWTTWIAATSTVLGAVAADRLSAPRPGPAAPVHRSTADDRARPGLIATTAWRLALALTAAVGSLITVPLVAVPARAAHRPDTFSPQTIAGGYAIVGVAVGLLVAVAALSSRAVATNVMATTTWLWALAVASALYGIAGAQGSTTAQLGVWRFGGRYFLEKIFSLPGAALMMGVALVIGVLAALPAGRRGDNRVGVAVSGAAGPLMVAAAYFLAAPRLVGVRADEQLSAYLIAPYAVIAGLAGSVLLSGVIAHREQRRAPGAEVIVPRQPDPPPVGVAWLGEGPAHAQRDGGAPAPVARPTADLPVIGRVPAWPGGADEPETVRMTEVRMTGPDAAAGPAARSGSLG
ncbi:hypothetical protein [Rugosimonospora acidiphila]